MNIKQKFTYKICNDNIPKEKKEYKKHVQSEINRIVENLIVHGSVRIVGIGIFQLRTRKATRMKDNIRDTFVQVEEKKYIHFKPYEPIKKYINKHA